MQLHLEDLYEEDDDMPHYARSVPRRVAQSTATVSRSSRPRYATMTYRRKTARRKQTTASGIHRRRDKHWNW